MRKSLNDLLRNNFSPYKSYYNENYYNPDELRLLVRDTIKEWLKSVAIGTETPETKEMRKTLIILIDEP